MKKIIVLLCLGLIGCATVTKEKKAPLAPAAVPAASVETEAVAEIRNIVIDEKEMDSVISIFSEALKSNPQYAGAYYNRAIAYFYTKDYAKSWQDVNAAESLGCVFSGQFLESLRKASGRQK